MSNKHLFINGTKSFSKRFSIDDAFEEETDEAIKVCGTADFNKNHTSNRKTEEIIDCIHLNIENAGGYKLENEGSRDSDSLIQDYCDSTSQDFVHYPCYKHPKVQENWRMVLAAVTLLLIGVGLLATGILAFAEPRAGLQGTVFLLAGFICFVPGAYHVVYIYLAAKGKQGYHFHNLPLFS
ncbi:transmembrane protein 134-like [Agrilus planipennis]|uniref:Transmembrane protein 134 n=1 Tax=Agrilus planipennis TaxID=224129 RepID=A0A1W4WLZ5_AGRPL|nr:transmembrane protein 134 [Agrilus planipennis]XP_018324929.1 transmembrane protein 134 [Agrilus planipennis]XP_025836248.1 transmembrane protein 134-like [Agrilus planipennis]XP_025836249.1 transmembrane protein 134-like [Agrilus planipennis]